MNKLINRIKKAGKEILGPERFYLRVKPTSFEEQIYCAAVRSGDICYDIGANTGKIALLLSRISGPGGFVIAFEPLWPMYQRMCQNIQRLTNYGAPILTTPLGLADFPREATLQVPANRFGMGSLADAGNWAKAQDGVEIASYNCRFDTLDHFRNSSNAAWPDFIKIDVEGAEWLVLQGAAELFGQNHRPLMLIELFAPWERAFQYGPWKVLSYLSSLGYSFLFACPQGLVEHIPTQSVPFPAEFRDGYNVLAFCPSKHKERTKTLLTLRKGGTIPILPMEPAPFENLIA